MARLGFLAVLAATLVLAPAARAAVQQLPDASSQGSSAEPTFRSRVELVTLNVSVADDKDRQLVGLTRDDFEVLEDGKPQEIQFFGATDIPLDVVLLIDTSSSMSNKLKVVQKAARLLIEALQPNDRAAVVEFNTQVRILQQFSNDRDRLVSAVDSTRARGGTALYMGLYIALDHFSRLQRSNPEVRKSAIVVLSDGEDTQSLMGEEEVHQRARRVGVPVYFISLLSQEEARQLEAAAARRVSRPHEYTLKTLSQETGGRAFFPSRLEDLESVYGSVARQLSMQYTIAYASPAASSDGSFRRVLVRLPRHPEARPRTRAGYYAAGAGNAMR